MSYDGVYDKAEWHYGGDYPAALSEEQAFVHSGMFLGWIIERELYSDWFRDELKDLITKFEHRELTCGQLFEQCDGVLTADMLSDQGNAFAEEYFDFEKGQYLHDYNKLLGAGLPTLYHVRDTWPNYDKLRRRVDRRFREWTKKSQPGLISRLIHFLKKTRKEDQ